MKSIIVYIIINDSANLNYQHKNGSHLSTNLLQVTRFLSTALWAKSISECSRETVKSLQSNLQWFFIINNGANINYQNKNGTHTLQVQDFLSMSQVYTKSAQESYITY